MSFTKQDLSNIVYYDNECDVYPVLKIIDLIITDYSSIYIDTLLINKKVIFFPFDINEYYTNTKDIDLPMSTNDSIELIKESLNALKSIYKKGYKYQKTGIVLSVLKNTNEYEENLFSIIGNEEKRKKLMDAIDYTNIKYGRNSLSIAQAGLKKKWNIKKQYSSKIDTASFGLLPTIGAS